MKEIQYPSTTRYVVAHNENDVAHVVEVDSNHVVATGQPMLEGYDTPGEQMARVLAMNLTQDQMDALLEQYETWTEGESVSEDDLRVFDGTLYEVIQGHTTQAGWEPPNAPALYTEVAPAGVIPQWTAPTGAHDAHDTGDQVSHNGFVWTSGIDGNTVEPGTQPAFDYWTKQV